MTERLDFLDYNLKPVVGGKRVWDFCCGTGMNGVYALENGAQYVHFSDVRESTFLDYTSNMSLSDSRYNWRYINTDNIKTTTVNDPGLDIIIYHGQFYHARNHYEILQELSKTTARYMSFESKGPNDPRLIVEWWAERTDEWTLTLEESSRERVLCGAPSNAWCRYAFDYFGWRIKDDYIEWRKDLGCHKWRYWLERK